MTDKQTLLDLADRVEAGEVNNYTIVEMFRRNDGPFGDITVSEPAYLTSQDAAQALQDAVLPGWMVNIEEHLFDWVITLETHGPNSIKVMGRTKHPAAARVVAILRAKASEL